MVLFIRVGLEPLMKQNILRQGSRVALTGLNLSL